MLKRKRIIVYIIFILLLSNINVFAESFPKFIRDFNKVFVVNENSVTTELIPMFINEGDLVTTQLQGLNIFNKQPTKYGVYQIAELPNNLKIKILDIDDEWCHVKWFSVVDNIYKDGWTSVFKLQFAIDDKRYSKKQVKLIIDSSNFLFNYYCTKCHDNITRPNELLKFTTLAISTYLECFNDFQNFYTILGAKAEGINLMYILRGDVLQQKKLYDSAIMDYNFVIKNTTNEYIKCESLRGRGESYFQIALTLDNSMLRLEYFIKARRDFRNAGRLVPNNGDKEAVFFFNKKISVLNHFILETIKYIFIDFIHFNV